MRLLTKIAIVGDPHLAVPLGDPDPIMEADPGRKLHEFSRELLESTLEEVARETELDAILLLGDLTRDSEEFNHAVMLELLQKVSHPLYIVLGNHDLVRLRDPETSYPGIKRLERFEVCQLYADRGLPGGEANYSVRLPGDVELIVLDSNLTLEELQPAGLTPNMQDDGMLGARRRDWLAETLKEVRGSGRFPLVSVHHSLLAHTPAERKGHPLFETFRFWRLHDAAETLEILSHFDVPLVLSGHLHAQSINAEAGVSNLVTSASVSYPHAWRLLSVYDDAIYVESRKLQSIPSHPDLQGESKRMMSEGMGDLIDRKLATIPAVGAFAPLVREMVIKSEWWARFSDGTLADFHIAAKDLPETNIAGRLILDQLRGLLNEYGTWKAARPDPVTVEIKLAG